MAAENDCGKATDRSGIVADDGNKARKILRYKTDNMAMH